LSDFPRFLDFCPQTFNLAVSQGRPGQVTRLASSRASCSGLQATPVDFARQRILTAYHPVSGIPVYSAVFGRSLSLRCGSLTVLSSLAASPERPVLSRAPGLHRARLRCCRGRNPSACWVCRLPLCLRFTVRRTESLSGASSAAAFELPRRRLLSMAGYYHGSSGCQIWPKSAQSLMPKGFTG
jgi:hypothetical protein